MSPPPSPIAPAALPPFQVVVVTLFRELFDPFFATSLLGKAVESGLVREVRLNPRDHAHDVHRTVDDAPFGGGAGMIMKPEPLAATLRDARALAPPGSPCVLLSPQGAPFTQARARALAEGAGLVLVCGRYEGVDDRVRQHLVDEEISIGDFVLSGGEVASMVVIEAVTRLLPGVLGNAASAEDESFMSGRLEYPQYTRPAVWEGYEVPEILRSGDHARIREWRIAQALWRTREVRPDLYPGRPPTPEEERLMGAVPSNLGLARPGRSEEAMSQASHPDGGAAALARRTWVALCHYPVLNREGRVVATAITNLDLHDIARASRTYGLAGYLVITPVERQRCLAERIVSHWRAGGVDARSEHRASAIALIRVVPDLDGAVVEVAAHHGVAPLVVATTARPSREALPELRFLAEREADPRPVLLLFGTGWGLAEPALSRAEIRLQPLMGPSDYNHLSVRSAVSIYLDRLFGIRS